MTLITNTFRIHSDLFIGSITNNLTPFQRQVSTIALAALALFTCYFVYRRCWQTKANLNADKKNSPQLGNVGATPKVVNDPSKIADTNAYQTRFIVHQFAMETRYTTGQDRLLHLDAEGRLQGITKQRQPLRDHDVQWLSDQAKEKSVYKVTFHAHNEHWKPTDETAFEFRAHPLFPARDKLPVHIRSIADMTLAKLNLLAAGAYKIAEAKQSGNWLNIFQEKGYSDDDLLKAVLT